MIAERVTDTDHPLGVNHQLADEAEARLSEYRLTVDEIELWERSGECRRSVSSIADASSD